MMGMKGRWRQYMYSNGGFVFISKWDKIKSWKKIHLLDFFLAGKTQHVESFLEESKDE